MKCYQISLFFNIYFPLHVQCDQAKQGIVNTPAKMDDYVKEHGFAGWFETSAKENINIEEAARALVNKVISVYIHTYNSKFNKYFLVFIFYMKS